MAMATAERGIARERTDVAQALAAGAKWGAAGAVVMALYAMVAGATYLGSGFFTPMHHIASTFIAPDTMMTSMERAMNDQLFYFSAGPAAFGMMVHLVVGIGYGLVFALIVRALNLTGTAVVVIGGLYGLGVLLFSSFVGLPLAASIFGGGDPIADMPQMVGWTTFTIEHVIYGVVLGIGWIRLKQPA